MAFCKYCGKELKDSESCSCPEAVAAAQAASAPQADAPKTETSQTAVPQAETQQKPATSPAATPAATAASAVSQAADGAVPALDTEKILGVVKEIGKSFLSVFTKPATAGREFVANAKLSVSLTMIVLQAFLSSIFSLFVIGAINGVLNGTWFKSYRFSGVKAFFLTMLFSLVGSLILAACFCLATMITRVKVLWRQLVALTAVRSIAVAPLIVLSWIFWLIYPALGVVLFTGSTWLAMAFLIVAVQGIEGMKDNKALWSVVIVVMVFLLIALILFGASYGLYLPASLRENINNLGSLINMFT